MALKLKLTKTEFDALPDAIKAEYKAEGEGYVLDVDGIEDTGALRRAHERTKQEAADARRERDEATAKLAALGDDAARKSGDIVTLENSWKKKLSDETGSRDATIATLQKATINSAVDAATSALAGKLTDHAAILSPHIRNRLTAEIDPATGRATLRVLDKEGKVSAMTTDDLQKEFAGDKSFSAIIRVSKASGGGAGGSGGNRGARTDGSGDQKTDLSRVTPKDLAARIRESKEAETGN